MTDDQEPYELIATHPRPIVAMVVHQDRLLVATADGVFERRDDGRFHELEFVVRNAGGTTAVNAGCGGPATGPVAGTYSGGVTITVGNGKPGPTPRS